jgi:MFS family permease
MGALRAVLRNPGIRQIELAWMFGIAGDAAMLVALLLVAFEDGGPIAVGLVGVARTAPAIVTGPIAGILATRSHPTHLLGLAHANRALTAVALTLWIGMDLAFAGVLALAALGALVGALVRPLTITSTPSLAHEPGELVAANVAMATGEGIGAFAGPLVAGLTVALSGTAAAALVATATLGIGAIAVARLPVTGDVQAELAAHKRSTGGRRPIGIAASLRAALVAGPAALRRAPGAAAIIVDFDSQFLVRTLATTMTVVASFELLGLGDAGVGLLGAAFGLGSLVGAASAVGLAGRRRLGPVFAVALSMWGLPYAVIGGLPAVPIAVVAFVTSGVANGILDVAGFSLIQRSVPAASRVSVFGFFESTLGIAGVIGGLLAPLLIVAFGTRGALGITGAILPILAVATWPRVARVDDEAQIPEDELRLLRGIPLFAALPMTALERIAGALRPTRYATGDTIFREGDPGDRYVIIAEGEVEVAQAGRQVNRLGDGEGIGEIALLNAVPRTATVTAVAPTRGYELSGSDFLGAIAGPTSMAAATLVARERLARSAE